MLVVPWGKKSPNLRLDLRGFANTYLTNGKSICLPKRLELCRENKSFQGKIESKNTQNWSHRVREVGLASSSGQVVEVTEEVANKPGDRWHFRSSHLGQTGGRAGCVWLCHLSREGDLSENWWWSLSQRSSPHVSSFSREDGQEAGASEGSADHWGLALDSSGNGWEGGGAAWHRAFRGIGGSWWWRQTPLERRRRRHGLPVKGVRLLVRKIWTTVTVVGMHSFRTFW